VKTDTSKGACRETDLGGRRPRSSQHSGSTTVSTDESELFCFSSSQSRRSTCPLALTSQQPVQPVPGPNSHNRDPSATKHQVNSRLPSLAVETLQTNGIRTTTSSFAPGWASPPHPLHHPSNERSPIICSPSLCISWVYFWVSPLLAWLRRYPPISFKLFPISFTLQPGSYLALPVIPDILHFANPTIPISFTLQTQLFPISKKARSKTHLPPIQSRGGRWLFCPIHFSSHYVPDLFRHGNVIFSILGFFVIYSFPCCIY
jgi:hypothetical protein